MMLVLQLAGIFIAIFHNYEATSWKHSNVENDFDYDELTPKDLLPKILTEDSNKVVDVGEDIVLSCDVVNLGEYSVIWHKSDSILWILQGEGNNQEIQYVTSNQRIGRNETSLAIKAVNISDEGEYTCEVSTNPEIEIRHNLTVLVPPSVSPYESKDFIQLNEGQMAVLKCQVSGNPTPCISWERTDNTTLNGEEKGNTLTIKNVTASDAGVYACVAKNGVGEPAKSLITLNIFYAPRVIASDSVVHSGIGYNTQIACIVDASPFPKVDWFRNNSPINPMRIHKGIEKGKRFFLYFEHILEEDFGVYYCNASNLFGDSNAAVNLTGRPMRPIIMSDYEEVSTLNYNLTWNVRSYSPILLYILSIKNMSTNSADDQWINITIPGTNSVSMDYNQHYVFDNLSFESRYLAKVLAQNEFGDSDFSKIFEVQPYLNYSDLIVSNEENEVMHVEDEIFNNDSEENTEDIPSAGTTPQTPTQRRNRMVSIMTAVLLSSFFYFSAMRLYEE